MYDLITIISLLLIILTIGCHIFSIRYIKIQIKENADKILIIFLIIVSFLFFLISRYLIYNISKKIPIAIIHTYMNLSVFVTLILSMIILKSDLNYKIFSVGLLIVILGIYLINKSIIE